MKIWQQEVNSQLGTIHLPAQANRTLTAGRMSAGGRFLGDWVLCRTTMGTGTRQQAAYSPPAFSASWNIGVHRGIQLRKLAPSVCNDSQLRTTRQQEVGSGWLQTRGGDFPKSGSLLAKLREGGLSA